MAEVTGLRNNALPYPVYGAPFGVVFPMLDADGDLVTGATTPDAEVSKNGDTFADCTNESTEIATNSGMYYLLLTATEMTADVVAVIAKSATAGMKTTPIVLYPRKLVTLRSGTVGANAADGTTLQLDSGAVAVDDYYNGCLLVGTLDSNVESRVISDYVGSTKVCTVSPAFVTTPDNNDTFVVYMPEGRQVTESNAVAWNSAAVVAPAVAGRPSVDAIALGGTTQTGRDVGLSVLLSSGTGTGQLDFTSGVVKANLAQILGTALTETSGQIAAAFKKFFDKAAPTGTINSLPDAVPDASGGLPVTGTRLTAIPTLPSALGANGNIKADVRDYNGTAGTFASGRPEVNTTHWKGTAAATADTAGYPVVTVKDGTGQGEIALTGGAVDTVTTLTNAPSDSSGVTTLLSRLSATRAGYLDNLSAGAVALESSVQSVLTKMLKYVQLMVRKDSAIGTDNATEKTAINANGGSGGGAFDQTTDALEALRDNVGTAGANLTVTAGTVSDKTGYALTSAYDPAKTAAQAGDAMALTSGERSTLTSAIWSAGARTLTAFGFAVDISAAAVTAIWDKATSALTTAGSIGGLLVDNVNATISSRSSHSAADVWAVATRTLSAFGFSVTVGTNNDKTGYALTSGERDSIADAHLDKADGVETGLTVRQHHRISQAANAGKLSGAATTTVSIRDKADSKNRIVATVDADGNRSAVTLDAS